MSPSYTQKYETWLTKKNFQSHKVLQQTQIVLKGTQNVKCEVSCKPLTQVGASVHVGSMVHSVGVDGITHDPVPVKKYTEPVLFFDEPAIT